MICPRCRNNVVPEWIVGLGKYRQCQNCRRSGGDGAALIGGGVVAEMRRLSHASNLQRRFTGMFKTDGRKAKAGRSRTKVKDAQGRTFDTVSDAAEFYRMDWHSVAKSLKQGRAVRGLRFYAA